LATLGKLTSKAILYVEITIPCKEFGTPGVGEDESGNTFSSFGIFMLG